MSMIYFPSCRFTASSPETSKKIKNYLRENHDVHIAGCCRPAHKQITENDTVLYICNTCAAFASESSSAGKIISLWELLAEDENFSFPNHENKKITLQDCWRSYDRIEQQQAVREILNRMNIEVVEMKDNRQQTRFCGTSLYNPLPKQNGELAPKRFIQDGERLFLPHTPEEQTALMKNHCDQIETNEVVSYCVACARGLELGGKKSTHLAELLFL